MENRPDFPPPSETGAETEVPKLIDPYSVTFDLDNSLCLIEEDSEFNIVNIEVVDKVHQMAVKLRQNGFSLSVYTAGFFERMDRLRQNFPEVSTLFDVFYTRESLIGPDVPPESILAQRAGDLQRRYFEGDVMAARWGYISVPPGLSEADYARIMWVSRNRGKVPALIGAGTMIEDGKKVRQIGGEANRVRIIAPKTIPEGEENIEEFIRMNFPPARPVEEIFEAQRLRELAAWAEAAIRVYPALTEQDSYKSLVQAISNMHRFKIRK